MSQMKECPVCGHELREDGFCEHCQKIPDNPPRSLRYVPNSLSIGSGMGEIGEAIGKNVIRVKKWEYDDKWKSDTIGDTELNPPDFVTDKKRTNPPDVKAIEKIVTLQIDALHYASSIPKIYVEPTLWEIELEAQASGLRIKPGVYFGIKRTLSKAINFAFTIIALQVTPISFLDILIALKGYHDLVEMLSSLVDLYIDVSADPIATCVIEAINEGTVYVANYDKLAYPVQDGVYGFRGVTTQEIRERCHYPEKEINEALIMLQDKKKKVIESKKGEWKLLLKD